MGQIIARIAVRVRAQSEAIRRGLAAKGISPRKVEVIPGAVDISKFTSHPENEESRVANRVGFVGRLTAAKGAPLLLSVVELAARQVPDVRFQIMGDGPYYEKFRLLPNVECVGWVPRETLSKCLSGTSIILSFQKELGLGELEAMAASNAIIATNVGEVPRTIKHLENGLLCEPRPEEYVRAISMLAADPDLLHRLAQSARITVANKFSWEVVARHWVKFLEFETKERMLPW